MSYMRKPTESYDVPVSFKSILTDFAVNFLMEQPDNMPDFGIGYFQSLKCKGVLIGEEQDSAPVWHKPVKMARRTLQRKMSIVGDQYDPEDHDLDLESGTKVIPKSAKERDYLRDEINDCLFLRSLDSDDHEHIIDSLFEKYVKKDEVIINEGDFGDYFYIISSGTFEATVVDKYGDPTSVKTYNDSGSFGELALLYNVPRAATVTAMTEGKLWVLKRDFFKKIVVRSAFRKRKLYVKLIESVPVLSALELGERMDLADALVPMFYTDGELIIKHGDAADGMYFIEEGHVEIAVLHKSGEHVKLKTQKQHEYFGELALVNHQPRAASAIARGKVKLAFLDVDTFERLLGPCLYLMNRHIGTYNTQWHHVIGNLPRNDSMDY